MKKINKVFIISVCVIISFTLIGSAQSRRDIVIGKIDHIYSEILQENREIWVHIPGSEGEFPVLYLLDGKAHFNSVVGMVRQLSTANGNTICPKMIVVGIANTNRSRDLTPTKGDINHPYVDSSFLENSGGGKDFLTFIEKELFPYIESNYPVQPYRMFIGHSYGGLTVLYTLFHHSDLFDAYIAIDPSLWWSDQKLIKEIETFTADGKFDGKSLYMGIANTMKVGMDTSFVMTDTTYSTMHIRSLFHFRNLLEKNFIKRLRFKIKYYPSDNHKSVPLITEYDAIRFIFDFYHFKFDSEDRDNPSIDLFNRIKRHYEGVSEKMGYEVKPDESLLNSLGYYYLSKEKFDKAEQFFKWNLFLYPESYRVFDAYGDYFRAKGDQNKAVEYYKESLSLNKDSYSRQKLDKLLKEIKIKE